MKKILISVLVFSIVLAIAMTGYMYYKKANTKNEDTTEEETIVEEPQIIDYGYIPIGQWGVASKYSSKADKYEDVYVGVNQIFRGKEAENIIKEYIEHSEYLTYNNPQKGMEWLVVEYLIDFADYEMGNNGANSDIQTRIKGYGENEDIMIDNKIYEIKIQDISNRDYTKENRIMRKICCTNSHSM